MLLTPEQEAQGRRLLKAYLAASDALRAQIPLATEPLTGEPKPARPWTGADQAEYEKLQDELDEAHAAYRQFWQSLGR